MTIPNRRIYQSLKLDSNYSHLPSEEWGHVIDNQELQSEGLGHLNYHIGLFVCVQQSH